jgi:hypothetical protein
MPETKTISCPELDRILRDAHKIPDGKKLDEGKNTRHLSGEHYQIEFTLTDKE